jgi:hypothetical protein
VDPFAKAAKGNKANIAHNNVRSAATTMAWETQSIGGARTAATA